MEHKETISSGSTSHEDGLDGPMNDFGDEARDDDDVASCDVQLDDLDVSSFVFEVFKIFMYKFQFPWVFDNLNRVPVNVQLFLCFLQEEEEEEGEEEDRCSWTITGALAKLKLFAFGKIEQ